MNAAVSNREVYLYFKLIFLFHYILENVIRKTYKYKMVLKDLWYHGVQQKCVVVTYNKLIRSFLPEYCTNIKKINKTSMTTKIIPNFMMAPNTYDYKGAALNRFNIQVLINETNFLLRLLVPTSTNTCGSTHSTEW